MIKTAECQWPLADSKKQPLADSRKPRAKRLVNETK